MRRALPFKDGAVQLNQEIGLFVPMVTAAHYIGKRARFWDIARHAERTVQDAVSEDEPLAAVPLPADFAKRLAPSYPEAVKIIDLLLVLRSRPWKHF